MYGEDDDINKGKIMVMRPGDTFHVYLDCVIKCKLE